VPRCRSLLPGLAAVSLALIAAGPAEAKRYTFGERMLSMGARGHDVRVLQDFLTRVGVETEVDGQFGPITRRRVRTWERLTELRRNGRVTRRDARALRSQVEVGATVFEAPAEPEPAPAAPGEQAVLGSDGLAIAPASAPEEVKAAIEAANRIVGKPYRYGGGHQRWEDSGYDCSGAVSYALHGAGLLKSPLPSGSFMSWGDDGPGSWISVYAHGGHAYIVIAGLRFDTGYNNAGSGPRWSEKMRPDGGYTVRHPPGL
jgi:peptidoglycan hydrolase-like protein with peptidoglycan-binding domain